MKITHQSVIGNHLGYRSRSGLSTLKPDEYPLRKYIITENDEHYSQVLPVGTLQFNKHYNWIDLGVGIIPKQRFGPRRALFDLALGYLSGFPLRDVIAFVWNFSLSEKRMFTILQKEGYVISKN